MDPIKFRHAISQFVAATVALMFLAVACFGGVIILFGQAGVHRLANLEAAKLSDVELTELVGTSNYVQTPRSPANQTVFKTLAAAVQIPFANPLTMLTKQLPQTVTEVASNNTTESSLFKPITTWATTKTNTDKIAMGWMPSTSTTACIQMLKDNPGINVASPSWYQLKDAAGNLSGSALPDVIQYAHAHHIKVWALVDNQFNAALTHSVLQSQTARLHLVTALATQAKANHLDGINIDFENVKAADRSHFSAFIQELHTSLHKENVNLSVDIAPDIVPLNDDSAFFHAQLASAADEVVLMAYDEHWSTDQEPGPVADVPWVTQSVYDLLNTGVPTNKLVLGIPFYTRFWYVHKNGHVTSEAISDGDIDNVLQAHKAPPGTWNSKLDLMYTRYPKPDGYMEAWYPTEQTMADSLALVNDNGLAGMAVWSLELSDKKTWSDTLNQLRSAVS